MLRSHCTSSAICIISSFFLNVRMISYHVCSKWRVSSQSIVSYFFYKCQLICAGKKPESLRWAFSIRNEAWECGHFSSRGLFLFLFFLWIFFMSLIPQLCKLKLVLLNEWMIVFPSRILLFYQFYIWNILFISCLGEQTLRKW